MILFLTFSEEGLISVWDLSTERGKVFSPFRAVPLVVICASAECKAGSDEEEGEVGAEEFDGMSTSIAYQFVGTIMGLDRRGSILLSIRRLGLHRKAV
jgi:hypothetical protein